MEKKEFIEKLADAIEVEDVESLSFDTVFKELDEWSSISVMMLIAFFDEEFDKQIGDGDILRSNTIEDLYNLATS